MLRVRRFAGPVLFVLFSIAVFAIGATIGANYQPSAAQTEQQPKGGAGEIKRENFGDWLVSDPTGFFTASLVVVGLAQLGLFVWQLRLIRESLDDAKLAANAAKEAAEAAKAHADAGKIQAETARLTLQTMQETAERQLRAYIFAHPLRFQNHVYALYTGPGAPPGQERRISYSLEFRNSGQTPAFGFVQITACDVFHEPPSEDMFSLDNRDPIKSSSGVLAAGSFVTNNGTYIVSPEEMAAITAGRKGFYVFGEFTYTDAFKMPRKGRFRFMHNKATGLADWAYAEAGNDEAEC